MATVTKKPTLGQWLQQARQDAGISQRQLDRMIGIDPNRLSAYENDRERMSVATLERIAEAIGLDLPWAKGRSLWSPFEPLTFSSR